jgi:hypothetical protein
MTKSIEAAIARVQRVARGVTGINATPDAPPATLPTGTLVSVCYEGPGEWIQSPADVARWLGELVVEVYDTTGAELPDSIAKLLPVGWEFPRAMFAALRDGDFTGILDTFTSIDSSGITSFLNAGKTVTGYRFRIRNVKIQSVID